MARLLKLLLTALVAALALPAAASAVETGMVYGPRTDGENVDQIDRAKRAGAEWVRIFVDWRAAEPTPGALSEGYLRGLDPRIGRASVDGKVLLVVTQSPAWASGSDAPNRPPRDPADFGSFLRRLSARFHGQVDAYELWNEPDSKTFWGSEPDPAAYAALLRGGYQGVKAGDPSAAVITGGMVGNDFRFLEGVYAAGGKGAFDAVGVHTDTGCLTVAPDQQYREPDGRIGRFSFTGYREVRRTMLANGDDKPIWMTELGWSTLTDDCIIDGKSIGRPSGVSEDKQAEYLTKAYRCLQNEPYMAVALWFSIQDVDRSTTRYDHRLGLLRDSGSRKPAYESFREFAQDTSRPKADCGAQIDETPPSVKILGPGVDTPYLDRITVSARAVDNQRVKRMDLYADGVRVPGSGTKGDRFRLRWLGARKLGVGPHVLTVRATDASGNVGEASVQVVHSDAANLAVPPARLRFSTRRLGGRRLLIAGGVSAPGSPVAPRGRVYVFLDVRRKEGWKGYSRFSKSVKRPFRFRAQIRKPGTWRVRVRYEAVAPFASIDGPTRVLGRFR